VRAKLADVPEGRKVFVRLTRADELLESLMADRTFGYGIGRGGTWVYQGQLGEEIADVAPGTYRASAGYYAGDSAESWTEIATARVDVVSGKTAELELVSLR
jgi:hypothetical protein